MKKNTEMRDLNSIILQVSVLFFSVNKVHSHSCSIKPLTISTSETLHEKFPFEKIQFCTHRYFL